MKKICNWLIIPIALVYIGYKLKSSSCIERLKNSNWKDLLKSFFYALLLAMVFRSFLFEFYKIPSGSMIPTLKEGDYLFISKYNYGYSKYSFSPFPIPIIDKRIFFKEPTRGDIAIFKLPADDSWTYIKRLIGLPGDEIQVKLGVLYINGVPVKRKKVGELEYTDTTLQKVVECDVYEETLSNGLTYQTLQDKNAKLYLMPNTTPVYKVPQGHYFFMGDNRDHSLDSRFLNKVGYIPVENLQGRAAFLMFTADLSLYKLITQGDSGRAFHKFKYAN